MNRRDLYGFVELGWPISSIWEYIAKQKNEKTLKYDCLMSFKPHGPGYPPKYATQCYIENYQNYIKA